MAFRRVLLLAAVLLALGASKASAGEWHRVSLVAKSTEQRWQPKHQPSRRVAIATRLYQGGHRLRDGISGECTALFVGRVLGAFSPCEPRLSLVYWGRGRFTFVYRIVRVAP
jgi:hypothetical protein